jgi:ribonuclease Z
MSIDILKDARILSWLQLFGEKTRCIFTNHGHHKTISTSYLASVLYTQKLRTLSNNIFVDVNYLPSSSMSGDDNPGTSSPTHPEVAEQLQVILASPLMKFHLKSDKSVNTNSSIVAAVEKTSSELTAFRTSLAAPLTLRLLRLNELLSSSTASVSELLESSKLSNDLQGLQLVDQRSKLLLEHERCCVWFLGTACAIPSKYRNVSGIVIELFTSKNHSYVLLEAGEGTWNQMVRMFNYQLDDGYGNVFVSSEGKLACIAHRLKLVWISHPHADHHLGLVTIVCERWKYLSVDSKEALMIIAPAAVISYLEDYAVDHPGFSDKFVGISNQYIDLYDKLYMEASTSEAKDNHPPSSFSSIVSMASDLLPAPVIRSDPNAFDLHDGASAVDASGLSYERYARVKSLWESIGIESIINTQVVHCPQAYGVIITLQTSNPSSQPLKIVYSGDTRPCLQLIHLGKDATILIHEATFEDFLEMDAISKRHTTISEAIAVGKAMNAYRVILTHFSQRYQSIPLLPEPKDRDQVILAFDYMHLSFKQLLFAPLLTDILVEVFPADREGDEDDLEELKPAAVAAVEEGSEQHPSSSLIPPAENHHQSKKKFRVV